MGSDSCLSQAITVHMQISQDLGDIEAGGETFTYIPCLNDDDEHITALTNIVQDNLGGWI